MRRARSIPFFIGLKEMISLRNLQIYYAQAKDDPFLQAGLKMELVTIYPYDGPR